MYETCRGELATLEIDTKASGQRFVDRFAVPAELGGNHEATQEPLEEHAFEDTRFILEALGVTAREALLLQPGPEDVGTVNDALGEGRGDTRWGCPDTPTLAPEVRVHAGLVLVLPD
jgi:hypothetical protein